MVVVVPGAVDIVSGVVTGAVGRGDVVVLGRMGGMTGVVLEAVDSMKRIILVLYGVAGIVLVMDSMDKLVIGDEMV